MIHLIITVFIISISSLVFFRLVKIKKFKEDVLNFSNEVFEYQVHTIQNKQLIDYSMCDMYYRKLPNDIVLFFTPLTLESFLGVDDLKELYFSVVKCKIDNEPIPNGVVRNNKINGQNAKNRVPENSLESLVRMMNVEYEMNVNNSYEEEFDDD